MAFHDYLCTVHVYEMKATYIMANDSKDRIQWSMSWIALRALRNCFLFIKTVIYQQFGPFEILVVSPGSQSLIYLWPFFVAFDLENAILKL